MQLQRLARLRHTVALGTLAAALTAVLAPAAQAATSVVADPGRLTVTAARGKTNVITVDQPGLFIIRDTGDTVTAGSNCTQLNSHTVSCAAAAIKTVRVLGGDLNDKITYNPKEARGELRGETGNDAIVLGPTAAASDLGGGAGDDALSGGPGDDALDGGDGADHFAGGVGVDTVSYAGRTAAVTANPDGLANDGAAGERDRIGTDIENLFGGSGNDVLSGSSARNRIDGRDGNDVLNGLGDNDLLQPGAGNDVLNGGGGDDVVNYAPAVDGRDVFSGGPGRDTASYRLHAAPVSVSLDDIPNDGSPGEGDNNLKDVEDVEGSSGNDTLTAHSTVSNRLFGFGGNDTLNTLDGVSGNDAANGGDGIDRCATDPGDVRACEL
jgi:Ca2+-binding RTX toxin-like protein